MRMKNTADGVHLSIRSNTLGIFRHSEQLASVHAYSLEMSGHTKHFIKTSAVLSGLVLFSIEAPEPLKREI